MDKESAERAYWDLTIRGRPTSLETLRTLYGYLAAEFEAGQEPQLPNRPQLEAAELEAIRLERLRAMADHAAGQTVYYREVFAATGLHPAALTWESFRTLPVTPKAHLRDRGADFVAEDAQPAYCSFTGGTTGGKPTALWWSEHEFEQAAAIQNIQGLIGGDVDSDIGLIAADSTQFLSVTVNSRAAVRSGDAVIWGRLHSPDATLDQLREVHRLGKRRMKPSTLTTFPSYWAALVEAGRRRGLRPADFGLRFVILGGEVLTQGLLRRAQEVFGQVPTYDVYGASELWGAGGSFRCPGGRFHFGHGAHFEFLSPDDFQPAAPGTVATMVATCLPPARETTLLLRYDTEDLFEVHEQPDACSWGSSAIGAMMGKRSLSLRHPDGHWTFPRQVLEGLEDVDDVPLPARCGFWARDDAVVVEVVAPGAGAAARARIAESLERQGLRLAALHLRDTPDALEQPYPRRCDGR